MTPSEKSDLSDAARFHWAEGMKYVAEGLRALFLLNGAATISVLTFIGNTNAGDDRLVYSMFSFALAALFGPISFIFSYLTQLNYGNRNTSSAWKFHNWTYCCIGISILLFLVGVIFAGLAFLEIGSVPVTDLRQ